MGVRKLNLKWPQEYELMIFHILGEVRKVPKGRRFRTKKELNREKYRGMLVRIPMRSQNSAKGNQHKSDVKTKPGLLGGLCSREREARTRKSSLLQAMWGSQQLAKVIENEHELWQKGYYFV